jgi:hypothetical protein
MKKITVLVVLAMFFFLVSSVFADDPAPIPKVFLKEWKGRQTHTGNSTSMPVKIIFKDDQKQEIGTCQVYFSLGPRGGKAGYSDGLPSIINEGGLGTLVFKEVGPCVEYFCKYNGNTLYFYIDKRGHLRAESKSALNANMDYDLE